MTQISAGLQATQVETDGLDPGAADAFARAQNLTGDVTCAPTPEAYALRANYPGQRDTIQQRSGAGERTHLVTLTQGDRDAWTQAFADVYAVEHGPSETLSAAGLPDAIARALEWKPDAQGRYVDPVNPDRPRDLAKSIQDYARKNHETVEGAQLRALPYVIDAKDALGPEPGALLRITFPSGHEVFADSTGDLYPNIDHFWSDNKLPHGRISVPRDGWIKLDRQGHVVLETRAKDETTRAWIAGKVGWHDLPPRVPSLWPDMASGGPARGCPTDQPR